VVGPWVEDGVVSVVRVSVVRLSVVTAGVVWLCTGVDGSVGNPPVVTGPADWPRVVCASVGPRVVAAGVDGVVGEIVV
jgi:hypothetical protein